LKSKRSFASFNRSQFISLLLVPIDTPSPNFCTPPTTATAQTSWLIELIAGADALGTTLLSPLYALVVLVVLLLLLLPVLYVVVASELYPPLIEVLDAELPEVLCDMSVAPLDVTSLSAKAESIIHPKPINITKHIAAGIRPVFISYLS